MGKSTLAEALCVLNGWALLDKDTVAGPLVDVWMRHHTGNPHDRSSAEYLQIRDAEYEALLSTAAQILLSGAQTVCVVAPFVAEGDLEAVEFTADTHGFTLRGLWVTCTEEEHRNRILKRASSRDHDKLAHLADWVANRPCASSLPDWMRVFHNDPCTSRERLASSAGDALGARGPIPQR